MTTTAQTYVLRPATIADALRIAEVHVAAWRTTYAGLMPDTFLADLSVPARAELWQRLLRDEAEATFVAEHSGELVGFASGGPNRDDLGESVGEIRAMYLLAAHQRKGVGARLWAAATAHLAERGAASVIVWLLRDNEGARRFYEARSLCADGASKSTTIGGHRLRQIRMRGPLAR